MNAEGLFSPSTGAVWGGFIGGNPPKSGTKPVLCPLFLRAVLRTTRSKGPCVLLGPMSPLLLRPCGAHAQDEFVGLRYTNGGICAESVTVWDARQVQIASAAFFGGHRVFARGTSAKGFRESLAPIYTNTPSYAKSQSFVP